ncbi:hypothetical protein KFZ70_02795 [Tamlana fucoidanivorans]|uniref:Uncharacterized protein n=1 Tax=Allotamlana fucoidanivorans TaxID=2583814 RepID=A0A5C4SED8_9FLAO|nr:hypothetical protein [Tamlana fucoidanivorans]TNJ41908.1 hypothetical protein FGF67_15225 [Tamlana fucoidanivorans]
MKAKLLFFSFFILTSFLCIAQSETPTVVPAESGMTEEERRAHNARLKMQSEEVKREVEAYKIAEKEKTAKYWEEIERRTKEAEDAETKIYLTNMDELELSNFEVQMAMHEALKKTNFYSYRYSGISEADSYNMVQQDVQMETSSKQLENSLNALGKSILDGIERKRLEKEAKEREQSNARRSYKENFSQKMKEIDKQNDIFNTAFSKNLDINFPVSSNVVALKKRILAVSAGYQDIYYTSTLRYDYMIVHQTIQRAYFKGNTLILEVNQEIVKTSLDHDEISPIKHTVSSIMTLDFDTNIESIKRKIFWKNSTTIASGNYLPSYKFRNETKKVKAANRRYTLPHKLTFSLGMYNGFQSKLVSAIWSLKQEFSRLAMEDASASFKNNNDAYTQRINNIKENITYLSNNAVAVYYYKKLPQKGQSPNQYDEINVLILFSDNRYIRLSLADEDDTKLFTSNKIFNNNWVNPPTLSQKVSVKIGGVKQKFVESTDKNYLIGGSTGKDLLLTGSHNRTFNQRVYELLEFGTPIKELAGNSKIKEEIYETITNPRIEVGKYEIVFNEQDINNALVTNKLQAHPINAQPSDRIGEPDFQIKLRDLKTGYFIPSTLVTYNYKDRVKVAYETPTLKYKYKALHYTPVSESKEYTVHLVRSKLPSYRLIKFNDLESFYEVSNNLHEHGISPNNLLNVYNSMTHSGNNAGKVFTGLANEEQLTSYVKQWLESINNSYYATERPGILDDVSKKYDDGSLYVGTVNRYLQKHGQGKKTYADGDVYEGEWQENYKSGFGIYTWPDGKVYTGEWKDDKRNGHGSFTWLSGQIYSGEWKDGKYNGQGKMSYANGDVYEGEWKNGLREGQGQFTRLDGFNYDGEWQADKQHGKGMLEEKGIISESSWDHGKMITQNQIYEIARFNGDLTFVDWVLEELNKLELHVEKGYEEALFIFKINKEGKLVIDKAQTFCHDCDVNIIEGEITVSLHNSLETLLSLSPAWIPAKLHGVAYEEIHFIDAVIKGDKITIQHDLKKP